MLGSQNKLLNRRFNLKMRSPGAYTKARLTTVPGFRLQCALALFRGFGGWNMDGSLGGKVSSQVVWTR